MDNFSILNAKLEDNKTEKIAFVIDLSDELKREDFLNYSGDKVERFKLICEEISGFIKIKDYLCAKPTEFALYSYVKSALTREIDFCELKEFDNQFPSAKTVLRNKISEPKDCLDLSLIYAEGIKLLGKNNISTMENNIYNSKMSINNETTVRFILFYNRSTMPAINSNEREYNLMTFTRLSNFCLDVLFFRKKIINEEDKRTLNEVYTSLTNVKPKFWYAVEISGNNLTKLKFFMNLLLANANQRIKVAEVDKHQKRIEEIITNFSEN